MKLGHLPIQWKIAILSLGIVLFSIIIGGIVILGTMIRFREEELGSRLMVIARTVAEMSTVQANVAKAEGWKIIDPIVERLRIINDITYIVVLDMDHRRLSHPSSERIGSYFSGEDAEPAFAEHAYTSKVKGEMGTAIRAYVPIINQEHQQIGVVVAGALLPSVPELISSQQGSILLTLFLCLLFGLWGSWRLAAHIKRQMFNREPHELARMFEEHTAAFQVMHEGVIAIDKDETITIFNEKAKQIFHTSGDVIGRKIREVIPDSRLPEILELDHPVYNQELRMRDALIWSNRTPIKVGNQTVGALAIFQDRTEVARMAEELTGVKSFVEALRVQAHEHMNKLHTIAGLIQLDQKEKALDYLFQVSTEQEKLSRFFKNHFAFDNISGLLLSKVGRGKELGITVTIDPNSRLTRFPPYLDEHDFVLLLGNLIENAYDALLATDRNEKEVYISIREREQRLVIIVEDNGCGMDQPTRARMLEKGFTTKSGENHGYGLYLIAGIVAKGKGTLSCESEPDAGTSFTITFSMEGE
ncbi:ATP-binding protein [Brevibacillus fulvus]|nr:sensor histidine kinase [Brevibacillus fulvus]